MLVVTRKPGESLTLTLEDGDEVVVKLISASNSQCRIGIVAPRSVNIVRSGAKNTQPKGMA